MMNEKLIILDQINNLKQQQQQKSFFLQTQVFSLFLFNETLSNLLHNVIY